MTIRDWAKACVLGAAVLLSACGGGGSDGSTAAPPSSNWDSMVWDEGKWG